jgi:O-antigen/teichoic acid export membrane protein
MKASVRSFATSLRASEFSAVFARAGTAGLIFNFGARFAGIAGGIILARLLGVEGYGLYALAIAWLSLLGVATEAGLSTLLVREVAGAQATGDTQKIGTVWREALELAALTSAAVGISAAIAVALLPGISASLRATMIVMLLVLPLQTLTRIIAAMLGGMRRLVASQFVQEFLTALLVLAGLGSTLMVRPHLTPPLAMSIQVAAGVVGVVTGLALLRLSLDLRGSRTAVTGVPPIWQRALPFSLINAALLLNTQIDTIVVGTFVGDTATGLYRVASQGALLSVFILQIIQPICSPYFARLYASGNSLRLARLFRTMQILGFTFASIFFLVVVTQGNLLIMYAFGSAYVKAYPLLVIITAGYCVNAACGPVGVLLAMTGNERAMFRILWTTAVINLISAVFAAHFFGALGVAATTAFSLALYHALFFIHAQGKRLFV